MWLQQTIASGQARFNGSCDDAGMASVESLIASRLGGSIEAVNSLRGYVASIAAIAKRVQQTLASGGTIYTAGNGGSAAQALHLAEEMIGRYRGNRRPLRAVCLNADPTALTCIANDFGFDQIFARQCEALLTERDALIVLSTSGRSANLVRALEVGRSVGTATIGLLGKDGGECAPLCDLSLILAGADSAPIQEAHQVVIHLICEILEGGG
jgi:D-sedoheptulose 7-phosphate isomerase